MSEKHQLTEKLRVIEVEIHESRIELKALNSKLSIAMSYEDDLAQRQMSAKKKTDELRQQFFEKTNEISKKYRDMKGIFDVFTGNFYNDINI